MTNYPLEFDDEQKISTHTLTWSVTYIQSQPDVRIDISTHTLTWSVTTMMPKFTIIRQISTHTLTWSVTRYEV